MVYIRPAKMYKQPASNQSDEPLSAQPTQPIQVLNYFQWAIPFIKWMEFLNCLNEHAYYYNTPVLFFSFIFHKIQF